MKKAFHQKVDARRRGLILRLLAEDAGHSLNHRTIMIALEGVAETVDDGQARQYFRDLEKHRLVVCEEVGTYLVARLTQRGIDVAERRERIEDVAVPTDDL